MPSLTSTAITFQVSPISGGAFADLKNISGIPISIPMTSGAIGDSILTGALAPFRFAQIIVAAQADGRIFQFVLKA